MTTGGHSTFPTADRTYGTDPSRGPLSWQSLGGKESSSLHTYDYEMPLRSPLGVSGKCSTEFDSGGHEHWSRDAGNQLVSPCDQSLFPTPAPLPGRATVYTPYAASNNVGQTQTVSSLDNVWATFRNTAHEGFLTSPTMAETDHADGTFPFSPNDGQRPKNSSWETMLDNNGAESPSVDYSTFNAHISVVSSDAIATDYNRSWQPRHNGMNEFYGFAPLGRPESPPLLTLDAFLQGPHIAGSDDCHWNDVRTDSVGSRWSAPPSTSYGQVPAAEVQNHTGAGKPKGEIPACRGRPRMSAADLARQKEEEERILADPGASSQRRRRSLKARIRLRAYKERRRKALAE